MGYSLFVFTSSVKTEFRKNGYSKFKLIINRNKNSNKVHPCIIHVLVLLMCLYFPNHGNKKQQISSKSSK